MRPNIITSMSNPRRLLPLLFPSTPFLILWISLSSTQFGKDLLNSNYVSDTLLDAKDMKMNKTLSQTAKNSLSHKEIIMLSPVIKIFTG